MLLFPLPLIFYFFRNITVWGLQNQMLQFVKLLVLLLGCSFDRSASRWAVRGILMVVYKPAMVHQYLLRRHRTPGGITRNGSHQLQTDPTENWRKEIKPSAFSSRKTYAHKYEKPKKVRNITLRKKIPLELNKLTRQPKILHRYIYWRIYTWTKSLWAEFFLINLVQLIGRMRGHCPPGKALLVFG